MNECFQGTILPGWGMAELGPRRDELGSRARPQCCLHLMLVPQAASQARQQHLSSLQDYMQRCTNELYWLDQQAKGRLQYDWSDRNLDYPSRRRQYEVSTRPGAALEGDTGVPSQVLTPPPSWQNFINRNLEAKEERINKLHTEGDQLLAAEHPGRNSIEVCVPQERVLTLRAPLLELGASSCTP